MFSHLVHNLSHKNKLALALDDSLLAVNYIGAFYTDVVCIYMKVELC